MTKKELEAAVRVWPSNVEVPLTRDQQIELMTAARIRHLAKTELIQKESNSSSE